MMRRVLLAAAITITLASCDDGAGQRCVSQHVERITELTPIGVVRGVVVLPVTHDVVICDRWVSR